MRVARQVSAANQHAGIWPLPAVKLPHRDAQRGRAWNRVHSLKAPRLGQQYPPHAQPWHRVAYDLRVQRVGQAYLPVGYGDRHQAHAFELLEYVRLGDRLQIADFQWLAQGEQFDDVTSLLGQAADPLLDQILQPAGRRQPVLQVPHPRPLDQRPRLDGAKDQFPYVQRIALGYLPEPEAGAGLDRPLKRQVQQRVEVGSAEVAQVDPVETAAAPHVGEQIGHRLAGPYRRDKEDRLLPGQIAEQRERDIVEQRHVVGDGDEAASFVPLEQAAPRPLEQHGGVELPVDVGLAQTVDQKADYRAERHQGCRAAADDAFGRITSCRRLGRALVG